MSSSPSHSNSTSSMYAHKFSVTFPPGLGCNRLVFYRAFCRHTYCISVSGDYIAQVQPLLGMEIKCTKSMLFERIIIQSYVPWRNHSDNLLKAMCMHRSEPLLNFNNPLTNLKKLRFNTITTLFWIHTIK